MKEFRTLLLDGLIALLMPVIILFGIVGGIVTPTEAAAVAVVVCSCRRLFCNKKSNNK